MEQKTNLKVRQKSKDCFFCKNGWRVKKLRFVYANHLTAWVCLRCVRAFGHAKVQQILDEIPYPPQRLNYQSAQRKAELMRSAKKLETLNENSGAQVGSTAVLPACPPQQGKQKTEEFLNK